MSLRNGAGRTTLNVVSSLGSYGLSLLIALYYTPFLIHELGLAVYSIIAITFALVQLAGPISQTISATINQRLVAAWEDEQAYNQVFSTAVWVSSGVSLFVLVVALGVSLLLPEIVNLPVSAPESSISANIESDARLVFVASAFSFTLSLLAMPISGVIFSSNSVYVLSIQKAFEAILRVMMVVALFTFVFVSLKFVALAIFVSAVAGAGFLLAFTILVRRSLRFSTASYSKGLAKGMVRTGGGVVMVQIGTLFLGQSGLIIVNLVYGPIVTGAFAAASQWATVVRGLISSVGVAITAHVMIDFNRLEGQARIASLTQVVRLLTVFASLPAGFIAGVAPFLLMIWVGEELRDQSYTLMALALPAAMTAVSVPILATVLAADRIASVGVGYVVVGAAYMLAAFFAAQSGLGGLDVAITLGFFAVAKNYLIVIPKAAKILGKRAGRSLTLASLYSFGWTLAATLICGCLAHLIQPQSFLMLAVIGVAATPVYAFIAYVTIPARDRALTHELMRKTAKAFRTAQ